MTKIKIGQTVRIKERNVLERENRKYKGMYNKGRGCGIRMRQVFFTEEMRFLCGKTAKIIGYNGRPDPRDGFLNLDFGNVSKKDDYMWLFTKDMLEPILNPKKPKGQKKES